MNADTEKAIKSLGVSIWVKAELETMLKRTAGNRARPLLNAGDPQKILADLMEKRYPLYGRADITVSSDHENADDMLAEALEKLDLFLEEEH
jgi:shikimate kinase